MISFTALPLPGDSDGTVELKLARTQTHTPSRPFGFFMALYWRQNDGKLLHLNGPLSCGFTTIG